MLENENLRQGYDTIRHRPQTLLCLILHSHAASLCQKIWQSYAKKHTFIRTPEGHLSVTRLLHTREWFRTARPYL